MVKKVKRFIICVEKEGNFSYVATQLFIGESSGGLRDGEVPSQKELSSYFEELFSSKVPRQKELSSSNKELLPNPGGPFGRC